MFPFVTVTIRRTHIAIALHRFSTTAIERLVPPADALDFRTVVIVRYQAAPIAVLYIEVELVTPYAV